VLVLAKFEALTSGSSRRMIAATSWEAQDGRASD